MRPLTKVLLAQVLPALALLVVTGCVITIGDGISWSSGWSQLDHSHSQKITLESDLKKLQVELGSGKIKARAASQGAYLIATILEEKSGDGYALLENGRLRVRSRSGQEVALGDVEIFLSGKTEELILATGSGDVSVKGIGLGYSLSASTGSGNVEVRKIVGTPHVVTIGTGSGSVRAESLSADELVVDTGSGSVEIRNVALKVGSFDTGSGNVRLAGSHMDRAYADTGSGNIDARGSQLGSRNFSTGSGSVRVDD